uniref:head-tail connector protein n=1 Tax=Stappia sp. TaxID=1870903 RepID=UPI003BACB1BD
MPLTVDDLKAHMNITGSGDDGVLTRFLAASQKHVERRLGFALDDATEFPDGTPVDLDVAVLQLAADWYENREASITGTIISAIPFGVREIVDEYRRYTFGAVDDGE